MTSLSAKNCRTYCNHPMFGINYIVIDNSSVCIFINNVSLAFSEILCTRVCIDALNSV